MARITWDNVGERFFETGVDHGVLYPQASDGTYIGGVAWNGLTTITERPTGGEANAQYADNIKYLNLMSAEEFEGTIEAFTFPDEFLVCDGTVEPVPGLQLTQQARRTFGLSYRTLIGNDIKGTEYGYKLHLVYGALAEPSEKARETVNDTPEAATMSWDFTTTPVSVTGYAPTAHLIIDSITTPTTVMEAIEELLYGDNDDAALPLPDAVIAMMDDD